MLPSKEVSNDFRACVHCTNRVVDWWDPSTAAIRFDWAVPVRVLDLREEWRGTRWVAEDCLRVS